MSKIKQEEAFLLRSFPFSNTSLILHLFTRKQGKQSFIVKGAYRNSRKYPAAYFSLFRKLQITFYEKEGRNLHIVKEIAPLNFYDFSRKNLSEKLLINVFAELIDNCVYPGLPAEELFVFIENYLQKIHTFSEDADFHCYHWAQLLFFLGIQPLLPSTPKKFVRLNIPRGRFENTTLVSYADTYLYYLLRRKRYKITETKRREACHLLWKYYKYHLPGFRIPGSFSLYEEIAPVHKE